MMYLIEILPQAKHDLEETLEYLSEHSPDAANRWFQDWLDCCDTLREAAGSFGLAPENSIAEFTVQQFVFRSGRRRYRVIYRVVCFTVYVYHKRGPGQDWVKVLEKTLPNG